jgi:nuclear pore complex protein Nup107
LFFRYISRLSEMNETQLVAFYVSKLGKRKQVLYAQHCEKILEHDDRQAALAYAEDFSLDVFAITNRIVESISNRPSEVECPGNLQRKLTEVDEMKISALDWLMFYPEQLAEALKQTNALIFKFLTLGKLEAAQLAINKIPHNSVEKICSEGEVSSEVNQTIKNYLSYKAYLDAQEAFNEWFRQFRNKPTPPADLPEGAQFTEKVAHKHKVSQHHAETERWKMTTSHSAKTAKTLLYNVLLFPEGWLIGDEDADYLRSVCIPEVVLLLYSVLSESGSHEEAVQLADLIAAEKHGLYKVCIDPILVLLVLLFLCLDLLQREVGGNPGKNLRELSGPAQRQEGPIREPIHCLILRGNFCYIINSYFFDGGFIRHRVAPPGGVALGN